MLFILTLATEQTFLAFWPYLIKDTIIFANCHKRTTRLFVELERQLQRFIHTFKRNFFTTNLPR